MNRTGRGLRAPIEGLGATSAISAQRNQRHAVRFGAATAPSTLWPQIAIPASDSGSNALSRQFSGTTYEKIPAQIDDIRAWPIRGIVVLSMATEFAENFKGFLRRLAWGIDLDELDVWLIRCFRARSRIEAGSSSRKRPQAVRRHTDHRLLGERVRERHLRELIDLELGGAAAMVWGDIPRDSYNSWTLGWLEFDSKKSTPRLTKSTATSASLFC